MSDLTITLEGSEVRADFFGTNAWLRNDGTSTIYAGRKPGVVSGAAGVVSVPAGGSAPVFDAHGTVYIIGTGSVQLIGSDYSNNPFKTSAQGGSGADEVARAAIEAHAGNSAIHLTAEQINSIDGGKTVEKSSSYTLDNAVDYPIVDMRIYGKSTQDGVPTPDAPVDIVSVGDSGAVGVTACGKNYVHGFVTTTKDGVTFTVNADGSVSAIGECSKQTEIISRFTLPKGEYVLSGAPSGSSSGNLDIYLWNRSSNIVIARAYDGSSLTKFSLDTSTLIEICLKVNVGTVNTIFYPQIELGDTATDYEPYKGSTASLTSALPLCGIPVDADGNYTDSTGQQWICDELIYNADGTGKIVKRVDTFTFDGSDDEQWNTSGTSASDKWRLATSVKKDVIRPAKTQSEVVPIICNSYLSNSTNGTFLNKDGIAVNTSGTIYIYNETCATYTLDEWKSYLASNPVTVVGVLNTPQEIQLTAEEMTALKALQTFDGITNISNDKGAEMRVKYCTNRALSEYVKPIKTGLQKQIDELKTAILSLGGNV